MQKNIFPKFLVKMPQVIKSQKKKKKKKSNNKLRAGRVNI